MKHTKEPWGVGRPSPNGQQVIGNGKGMMIAIANPTSTQGEVNANAERIVACVNACTGITNDALEAGIVKEAMELFWIVSDKAVLNENNQMTYNGKTIFISDMEDV